jgi:hypothetical protein
VRSIFALCFTLCVAACHQPISCANDRDCPSTMICQQCNTSCVYAPNTACDLKAPCPCGWACMGGTCRSTAGAPQPQCTFNRECPVDMFCNRAIYRCQYAMALQQDATSACTTNGDCASNEVCSTALGMGKHVCALNATRECRTDADCDTANGDVCLTGNLAAPDDHQCTHESC